MNDRAIEDYGGPFKDGLPVEDAETQVSSAQYNRLAEDAAQLTRTGNRAIVAFRTTTAGNPTVVKLRSVWGNGVEQHPATTRLSAGAYKVTFAQNFTDALGQIEDVFFDFSDASLQEATPGFARVIEVQANELHVQVFDSTWAPSDLGGARLVVVWAR